ncbi:uncharacterized protein EI90DRAFT_3059327 [Cantharellus anzutake]|uniref:uncharacterized protein n=1 Tax=Cantharellus anzutake TaxID=1750568 RepID=UPI0019066846|nr:uncharacterized protein EI90DRAFT_3059327 [Cantharellus anzutake]KAF8330811.1 hypothetical protein EI90DRAFT_3059327 [Cantharellus anzutake]
MQSVYKYKCLTLFRGVFDMDRSLLRSQVPRKHSPLNPHFNNSTSNRDTGCLTCRLRRKKCKPGRAPDGACEVCTRLAIECMGYARKRPQWMQNEVLTKDCKLSIKRWIRDRSCGRTQGTLRLASFYGKERPVLPTHELTPPYSSLRVEQSPTHSTSSASTSTTASQCPSNPTGDIKHASPGGNVVPDLIPPILCRPTGPATSMAPAPQHPVANSSSFVFSPTTSQLLDMTARSAIPSTLHFRTTWEDAGPDDDWRVDIPNISLRRPSPTDWFTHHVSNATTLSLGSAAASREELPARRLTHELCPQSASPQQLPRGASVHQYRRVMTQNEPAQPPFESDSFPAPASSHPSGHIVATAPNAPMGDVPSPFSSSRIRCAPPPPTLSAVQAFPSSFTTSLPTHGGLTRYHPRSAHHRDPNDPNDYESESTYFVPYSANRF